MQIYRIYAFCLFVFKFKESRVSSVATKTKLIPKFGSVQDFCGKRVFHKAKTAKNLRTCLVSRGRDM